MSAVAAEKIYKFRTGSYNQVLESRQNKSFILMLWSLDCPSCYKELKMLAGLKKEYPLLDVVLVSTDIEAADAELTKVLSEYHLEDFESWVFSGSSEEQLRFEIDHTWYGELPRSYFFRSTAQRQVVSGVLALQTIEDWFTGRE